MKYTDEEKEAIEDLNKLNFLLDDVYSTGLLEGEERDEYQKSIHKVLDIIENLKDKNKDLLKKLKNRVKEVKKLIKYSQYKKEFSRLNKQLKEKQKSIENSISKKEIREKIEELYLEMSRYEDMQAQGSVAYMQTYHAKNVLEELLGEDKLCIKE